MTQSKDPRREDLIREFTPIEIEEELDYTNIFVSTMSFSSIIFKNKWFAWLSLVGTISGFLDEKSQSSMFRGNLTNIMMTGVAFIVMYMPIIFPQKNIPSSN
ncbi:hypothetical protein T552_02843 [Pneumocystis carinii B80]|uniref:Protein Asterix n=1 Tax=Pneumocystis carinii (strain B80) TaxID=1408658 RepID=A0A0W4ZD98_PNEC8|nr:hypothetical protein T552_02843 [Pneumocystis carinii B80]KTW26361.1 hypothetical protein T552_02843 [Pneumocystis carinii B80]